MDVINKLIPWFVLAAVLTLLGNVIWYLSQRPVTGYEIFLLLLMTGSGAGWVWGSFRMNAIFDRIEKRAKEHGRD